MNVRLLFFIYMAAFVAGAVFKAIHYLINPDDNVSLNSIVMELTIASAFVTGFLALFKMFKSHKSKTDQ